MATTSETIKELQELRKGRGLAADDLRGRVGPRLRALCGLTDADTPLTFRRSITLKLTELCEELDDVGVELGCFPHLLLRERWGCGVDAAGAEQSAYGAAVAAEAIGELVDAEAGLILLDELIDLSGLELVEGREGLGWRCGACAVRRICPGLGKIKKPLNSGGGV